jgi:aminomethyltransferase
MLKTPLFEEHVALGARMAPFGDWDMPIQYSGIIEEHLHTRTHAGLFDICHMGEFIVRGPQALADLSALITAKFSALKPGQCKYGFLLNEEGGILDDLITYRLAEEEFMIVVNSATTAGDREWIQSRLSSETMFEDISDRTAKIDLQGPAAQEVLQPLCSDDLSPLKYFQFMQTNVDDIKMLVSRTGYTGEFGYELYMPAEHAVQTWQVLLTNDKVLPVGLGARDTLRLEVGLPLYGHELGPGRSPVSAGMTFAIDTEKEFTGKARVMDDINNGTPDRLAGLTLPGRQSARAEQRITVNGDAVGAITSGSFAPSLGHAVALAYVNTDNSVPGTELRIETGRKQLPATITTLPFYTEGTARRK